jgi:hypothetical protein
MSFWWILLISCVVIGFIAFVCVNAFEYVSDVDMVKVRFRDFKQWYMLNPEKYYLYRSYAVRKVPEEIEIQFYFWEFIFFYGRFYKNHKSQVKYNKLVEYVQEDVISLQKEITEKLRIEEEKLEKIAKDFERKGL